MLVTGGAGDPGADPERSTLRLRECAETHYWLMHWIDRWILLAQFAVETTDVKLVPVTEV
jgi:hypothetical protein